LRFVLRIDAVKFPEHTIRDDLQVVIPSFATKPGVSLKNYDSSKLKTLDTVIASAEETFSKNVEAVHKLMEFDDALIQFFILRFSNLALRLEKSGIANNLTLSTNRDLDQLKRIRENQSLRSQKYWSRF
jgi:hypothetical protein